MIASLLQHTAMIYCECHSTVNCQWPQASHMSCQLEDPEHSQINVYNEEKEEQHLTFTTGHK